MTRLATLLDSAANLHQQEPQPQALEEQEELLSSSHHLGGGRP